MREWITNLMVIGLSAAFLWHFSLIAMRGSVTIQEPSLVIFTLEIAMLVGFVVFAVVNMVSQLRRA